MVLCAFMAFFVFTVTNVLPPQAKRWFAQNVVNINDYMVSNSDPKNPWSMANDRPTLSLASVLTSPVVFHTLPSLFGAAIWCHQIFTQGRGAHKVVGKAYFALYAYLFYGHAMALAWRTLSNFYVMMVPTIYGVITAIMLYRTRQDRLSHPRWAIRHVVGMSFAGFHRLVLFTGAALCSPKTLSTIDIIGLDWFNVARVIAITTCFIAPEVLLHLTTDRRVKSKTQ